MASTKPEPKQGISDVKTHVSLTERLYDAEGSPRVKLPHLTQLGIVVKDVDKAVEYYSSVFGIGPWRIIVADGKENLIRGKKMDIKVKIAFAQHGPIEFEFIEVLGGDTPHAEFLRERGEGIQHLGFGYVKDLRSKIAELAKDGYEPVLFANTEVFDEVYLESKRPGAAGVHIQLREMKAGVNPKLLAQLGAPQAAKKSRRKQE